MPDVSRIQGELQEQIMAVIWRLGSGNVEQVRDALPARYQGAYTTVQTVLNRLADRGLLSRTRNGRSFSYEANVTEAEYLSRAIARTLAHATASARQTALAELLGNLDDDERSELQKLARKAARQRGR